MKLNDVDFICKLRFRPDKSGDSAPGDVTESRAEEESTDSGEYILCSNCRHIITYPAERIEKIGSHHHTFANPHGIVYEIGCFRSAGGCGYAGPISNEFSWFGGFSWRVAICSQCLTHLGWLFLSSDAERFHGLILDRLLEAGP